MLSFLLFTLVANLVAVSVVGGFEALTGLFGMSHWVDYAFAIVLTLWAISAFTLSWQQRDNDLEAGVTYAARTAELTTDPSLFLKFFLAGLPAFILCVVVAFSSYTLAV
ncbi:hypothetical protein LRP49_20890 [Enterovibrio sp. ZSDZ35]|uniref:Uncharacterized protein n=1 Tax=Enterovibrio qingdaonensis TaxID=2899818 RepID=A0ABT5QRM3_9GAMM|nr:hypothetical protein [Enterovibrio sp. ZSDZ35]MDD1783636.1 hypothetical protein [Enterovibrio sp. ZSDZ35]